MRSISCTKCNGSMQEGFSTTEPNGLHTLTKWFAGKPIKGWFGIKVPKKSINISIWRCNRCGYLEHYAKDSHA